MSEPFDLSEITEERLGQALALLEALAMSDTGGGQAVRSFLFWLARAPDPTGYVGSGGLEFRRMDPTVRGAAFLVLEWWGSVPASDSPLFDTLEKLRKRFEPSAFSPSLPRIFRSGK